jgi:tetratricopeptide (TPR) repeat protein
VARAAVKAKQQQRAKAQPAKAARARGRRGRHAGGGNPNQDLFFMKLRRHAKWAYVVLAVLFAATFAAVGVGSGSNGLSQLFSGIFGGSGNGTSVASAQAEIKNHPAKGYRDLARAYEGKGETASAVAALQSYVGLKPKDALAWSELGGQQLALGSKYSSRYQRLQQAQQQANPGQALLPAGTLGQILGSNPIQQLSSQKSSALLTQYSQQASTEYGAALQSYQKAAKLKPHDAQSQYNVAQAAQAVGQYQIEVAALKKYLVLYPSSPQKSQIKSLIKSLTPAAKPAKKKSK